MTTTFKISKFNQFLVYLEWTHEGLIYTHHSAGIVELPAVVWGGEQSHKLPLCKEFISILNHLKNKQVSKLSHRIKHTAEQ